MRRYCFLIILVFGIPLKAETLESLRQQFEIYQRHSGEIEILSGDNVQEIDHVLQRTESKRLTARKALEKRPTGVSSKETIPTLFFAEHYALPFKHYVAVERAAARRSLQQNKPDEAMQSIQYIYRLADKLSESESLALRTAAAQFRLQMLETVQSLLLHPLCRHEQHEQLYTFFEEQLNRRETDKTTWTRYSEEGKRFFDETRRSGLDKTVPPALLNELMTRHALDSYEQKAAERLARDQSVFLEVMSAAIDACEMPYYRRRPVLQRLDKELKGRQGTSAEPAAAMILLKDVSESMRLLAQEQSGLEMVYLALGAALHGHTQRKTLNFLTGTEYELHLITDGVMCTYSGNIKPFYVPYRQSAKGE